jgi:hypothetical protein
MPAPEKRIIPFIDERPWAIAMYAIRTIQVLFAITALGLDVSVLSEWNKNKFQFNSALQNAGSTSDVNITTWVGGTPFTGIVMFTVSLPKTWLFAFSFLEYINLLSSVLLLLRLPLTKKI